MKKIILGLTLALVLTGCQQQLPYTLEEETLIEETTQDGQEEIVEEEVEQPVEQETIQDEQEETLEEVNEEYQAKIEEYKDAFKQLKIELENKRSIFEVEVETDAGTFDNIFECLNWYIYDNWGWQAEYSNTYVFYEGKITYAGDLFKKHMEIGKKDLAEVEAQYSEINSLIQKASTIVDNNTNLEIIAAEKIELENKVSTMVVVDIQALVEKCEKVHGSIYDDLVEVR